MTPINDPQMDKLRRSVDSLNKELKGRKLFAEYRSKPLTFNQKFSIIFGVTIIVVSSIIGIYLNMEEIDLYFNDPLFGIDRQFNVLMGVVCLLSLFGLRFLWKRIRG
jgi:hypothetical protein